MLTKCKNKKNCKQFTLDFANVEKYNRYLHCTYSFVTHLDDSS